MPLSTLFTGQNLIRLAIVDSTNNYAAKLMELPHWENGTAILAEKQSEGRGQMGQSWESSNNNFYCSFLFKMPFLSVSELGLWNQAVALAAHRTLSSFSPRTLHVKWPNDLLSNQGKVGGILVENSLQGDRISGSVVGFGFNTTAVPEIGHAALVADEPLNNLSVFETLSQELEQVYLSLKAQRGAQIVREYNDVLWKMGSPVEIKVNQEKMEVLFEGQDAKGQASFLSTKGRLSLGIKTFEWLTLPYSK